MQHPHLEFLHQKSKHFALSEWIIWMLLHLSIFLALIQTCNKINWLFNHIFFEFYCKIIPAWLLETCKAENISGEDLTREKFVSNDNLLKVTSKLILCFLWSFTHLVLLECSAKVSAFMVVVRIAGLDPAACSSWNLHFIPHFMLLCLPSDLLFHKFLYFQALWAIASLFKCV